MRRGAELVNRSVVGGPTAPGAAMTYPPSYGAAIAVTGWGRMTCTGFGLHAKEYGAWLTTQVSGPVVAPIPSCPALFAPHE
jgi:hypothetical protein